MKKFLIVIIFILLGTCIILFVKGDYHNRLISKLGMNTSTLDISQKQLSLMNNGSSLSFTDLNKGSGDSEFRVVLIGNSLAVHNIAEDIGWTHVSGMAASSADKDYVHILLDKLSSIRPNEKIKFRISNFASFERNPNILNDNLIDSLILFKPHIVVFQLGENVDEDNDLELFEKKYVELIID